MDDLIPHPFASILFALVVGAFFLSHGFEENRPPKRLAYVRPFFLNEKPQTARLSQQIQSVPLRGETDIKPKPTKKTYYRVIVPDSGTLQASDVVIKLNGIVASKADAQCQDEKGKSWPCGAAAKTALRQLIRARAVVCDLLGPGEHKSFTARCAVSGTGGKGGRSQTIYGSLPSLMRPRQRSPSVSAFGRNRLRFDEHRVRPYPLVMVPPNHNRGSGPDQRTPANCHGRGCRGQDSWTQWDTIFPLEDCIDGQLGERGAGVCLNVPTFCLRFGGKAKRTPAEAS